MTKFKKFSLMLLSAVIFICSAVVFSGCKDKNDTYKLYVFSSVGGYVQIDDHEEVVEFGDEGSKVFTYNEGDTVKLKAIANAGYRFSKWIFNNDLEKEYILSINNADIEIKLNDDIVIKAEFEVDDSVVTYDVSYPTNTTGYTFTVEDGYTSTVVEGGDFKFKITLWEDYSDSDITVKANSEVLTLVEGAYTISNITADTTIIVEGVVLNAEEEEPVNPTIYGIFERDTRFKILPVSHENCEVEEGESFIFKIQLVDGYKLADNAIIKADNQVLTENNGQYTITSVNKNIEITIQGIEEVEQPTPTKYSVTTQDTKFVIVPVGTTSNEVEEGSSFTFKIQLNAGYKFGETVVVKANGTTLNVNDGKYTIESVTSNIEIVVEGIEEIQQPTPTKYSISTQDTRFVIIPVGTASNEVEEGSSFTFKIQLNTGYEFGETVVVKANGTTLNVNDDKYTIASVTSNTEIVVEGIEEIEQPTPTKYSISTQDTRFIIVPVGTTSNEVEDGSSFTFKIQLNAGYKFGEIVVVKANGTILNVNNDKYTIASITSNTEIVVEGIEEIQQPTPIKYSITTQDTRFVIVPVGTTSNEVEEGLSFTFTIDLTDKEKYEFGDNLVVKANGIELVGNNDQYTIQSIVEDVNITVEGIQEKTPEVVTETYTFIIEFEDSVIDTMEEIVNFAPESIAFSINEDEKQDQYKASEFMVIDNQQQEMSIKDIIDTVNDAYGLSTISQFTIGGFAFIVVDGENITINWDLLTLTDSTYSLVIEM